jgi:AraC-like DNA-binding protein
LIRREARNDFGWASTDHACTILLPSLVNTIREGAPRIKLEVSAWRTRAYEDVAAGRIDAALSAELSRTEIIFNLDFVCIVGSALRIRTHRFTLQSALAYAKENLGKRLSVDDLAAAAFLSARQFSRLFRDETGQTPAKAIERLRVEAARLMMEAGRFSAEEIARKNGFGNRDRMRRSFLRAFGQPPQVVRRTANLLMPQMVSRTIRRQAIREN